MIHNLCFCICNWSIGNLFFIMMSKLLTHTSSKISLRKCIISGNWSMLVCSVCGFMSFWKLSVPSRKCLNNKLKSIKEDIISKVHAITNVQFGDTATYTITHSITILITQIYFKWDFLIFPAATGCKASL